MPRFVKPCWPAAAAVAVLLAVSTAFSGGQEKKHGAKELYNSLREVINTGADLFNLHNDYAGCFRVYHGALLAIKPFVTPEQQTEITRAIANAERMPKMSDRAFEMRRVIDLVRNQLRDGQPSPKDNTPPHGFIALFNGKDLTNWQGLIELPKRKKLSPEQLAEEQEKANKRVLPNWTVTDGVLHYDGKSNSLQTVKDYGDFELFMDWKLAPKGDSGIYLRGNPQVQMWDNPIGSGGLFNNAKNPSKPLAVADRPVGEWNTFHIVMRGDRVTIKLNGKLVVDRTPLENYWEKDQPLPEKGPIELQHHGDPLWFKNIYLKELAKREK